MCVFFFCSLSYPACKEHKLYYVVICGLSGSTMFFDIISQKARFSEKSHWTQNKWFGFLYNFCLKHFSVWEELSETLSSIYRGLHAKYQLFLSYFNGTWVWSTDFRTILMYQISQNPSSPKDGELFHAGGRADTHTHIKKLTVAFRPRRLTRQAMYRRRVRETTATVEK